MFHFYTPTKTSEKLWFSDIYKGKWNVNGMKWNTELKSVQQFKVNDLNIYYKLTNFRCKSIDWYLYKSNS